MAQHTEVGDSRLGRVVTWKRVLISVLLATAIGIPLAITIHSNTDVPPAPIDNAIQQLFPAANDLDLRQTVVGLQLTNQYTFSDLELDGRIIPDDQLDRVTALNQITFRAGANKDITSFTPGNHCATASYQPLNGSALDVRTHTWCFNLH